MADRQFDKTQLRESSHGDMIHRDYLAHALRWSWAARSAEFGVGGKRVVDVGCGQDLPLFKATGTSMGFRPEFYVGIDMNVLPAFKQPSIQARTALYSKTDFTDPSVQDMLLEAHGAFDRAVNFEVIEHMGTEDGDRLLAGFRRVLKDDGLLILSTPVYDGVHHAKNHIHEYYAQELADKFVNCGFRVVKRYGTFGNVCDIKEGITDWCLDRNLDPKTAVTIYESLQGFHSNETLSNFLTPLIPDFARNNVWVCAKS